LPSATEAAFAPQLELLVHAVVPLTSQPEVIGQTPGGYLVNWPPVGGTVVGPAFDAVVIPGGKHEAAVRPDGIGIVSASVTLQTRDNALILLHHSGIVDYGPQWANEVRLGRWPPTLPVRTHISLLTSDQRYAWLNRLMCISVGEVRTTEPLYSYSMYAIR
jgi:hypothetical protein